MKEIDFDELDKAVNSLMNPAAVTTNTTAPAKNSQASESDAASVPNESSSAPVDSSALSPVDPATKPIEPTKKIGRFMDVFHPSSDMRTAAVSKSPSRKGMTIVPPSRPITDARPVETGASDDKSAPVSLEHASAKDKEEVPSRSFSFPDPLELASKAQEKHPSDKSEATLAQDVQGKANEVTPTPTGAAGDMPTVSPESAEPSQSLFLPDVQVEKRPLGASSADDSATEGNDTSAKEESQPDIKDPAESPDATAIAPEPILAELGEDVLAIESDTSSASSEANEDKPEDATTKALGTSDAADTLAPTAISSIPRQYTVKPSDDDKHHEALYDAAAQAGSPLQHPEKKKSGWFVVLWIVLLIVIGVGGALALYFLKVF